MRNIPHNIRIAVKSGNSIPAVVIDTVGNRVSVRLSSHGAIYRNLLLVGGPVSVGDQVHVDMTTSEPTVVAPGVNWNVKWEQLELSEFEEDTAADQAGLPPTSGSEPIYANSMIEVYQMGDWNTTGSGGVWYRNRSSGSYFDANAGGLDAAISWGQPGSAIFIPGIVIGGHHDFWYGQTVVGLGVDKTMLTGQITFRDGFYCRDLSVVRSATSSGLIASVIIYGDGYFYNTAMYCINYGAGDSIALMNYQNSSVVVGDQCHFEADYGIVGNPDGGKGGLNISGKFMMAQWYEGQAPPWYVDFIAGTQQMNFWSKTQESFPDPTFWILDGFRLVLVSKLYERAAPYVTIIFSNSGSMGFAQVNEYSKADANGHRLEDQSFYFDYGDVEYGQGANPNYTPEIPTQDQGVAYSVGANPNYTEYGGGLPNQQMKYLWYYQDCGLGADMSSGSAGSQSERTATDWAYKSQKEYTYIWFTRRMGGTNSGSDFDQPGYSLDIKPQYAYITEGDWKHWLYPTVFRAKLTRCSFNCSLYDVYAEDYCLVVVDPSTYSEIVNKLGNVVLESSLGLPDFSSTEPTDPFPGMMWYPLEG